ncbi:MAG TPA: hypothetical protein VGX68_10550 [Thermoanaerobaculia bacterium]|jgi:hypothetical protein|nr:hypothetical protein [Thermoanaerobaculia bacterium]
MGLDWMFYQRRFGGSSVKVGRVQIPFGIYNEVRDVGTLLPFYRPSDVFYGEGHFATETVDGIVLSHAFGGGSSWQLDGDLHYGSWSLIRQNTTGGGFSRSKANDSLGVELWLTTPVPGLRIGTGGMRFEIEQPDGGKGHAENYHGSLAWELGRVATHIEARHVDLPTAALDEGYIHLGVQVADKVTVNGQYDTTNAKNDIVRKTVKIDKDTALGVNYAFRPDLVLKLENHWNEGYLQEDPPLAMFMPQSKTRYWIASLSTSF